MSRYTNISVDLSKLSSGSSKATITSLRTIPVLPFSQSEDKEWKIVDIDHVPQVRIPAVPRGASAVSESGPEKGEETQPEAIGSPTAAVASSEGLSPTAPMFVPAASQNPPVTAAVPRVVRSNSLSPTAPVFVPSRSSPAAIPAPAIISSTLSATAPVFISNSGAPNSIPYLLSVTETNEMIIRRERCLSEIMEQMDLAGLARQAEMDERGRWLVDAAVGTGPGAGE
ncbi:hypothetical protein ONS96_000587 [Cadophora gregata f. sp. sojae]|nr:hypothetical protein ONS96_000587 [Cadophora gregata f. sp. sojae]